MGKLMSGAGVDPLVLCQVEGPGPTRKVRVLPLEEVVLGRDDDCEIILDEGPVSRMHAKVVYQGYQPELHDLGSTNGTFLNGKRVRRAFLKHGDRFQVGANVFEVRLGLETTDAAADVASATALQVCTPRSKSQAAASWVNAVAVTPQPIFSAFSKLSLDLFHESNYTSSWTTPPLIPHPPSVSGWMHIRAFTFISLLRALPGSTWSRRGSEFSRVNPSDEHPLTTSVLSSAISKNTSTSGTHIPLLSFGPRNPPTSSRRPFADDINNTCGT